jgi:hypothetical protein
MVNHTVSGDKNTYLVGLAGRYCSEDVGLVMGAFP